jgi:hypothetical protein
VNEQDFTRRLESILESGLASTPLPALEPARARYRIATANLGRGHTPRLLVAVAATGLALCAGVVGAAASGTSPATLVSVAVHRVVIVFEEISNPRVPVPSTSFSEPGPPSAPGSEPIGVGLEPLATVGSGSAPESPSPATTEEPAPAPIEGAAPAPTNEPAPVTTEAPEPVPSETTEAQPFNTRLAF